MTTGMGLTGSRAALNGRQGKWLGPLGMGGADLGGSINSVLHVLCKIPVL